MASWVGNGVGTGEETVFVSGARQPGAWSGLLGFLWLISLLSVDRGPLTVRHKGLECLKGLKRLERTDFIEGRGAGLWNLDIGGI